MLRFAPPFFFHPLPNLEDTGTMPPQLLISYSVCPPRLFSWLGEGTFVVTPAVWGTVYSASPLTMDKYLFKISPHMQVSYGVPSQNHPPFVFKLVGMKKLFLAPLHYKMNRVSLRFFQISYNGKFPPFLTLRLVKPVFWWYCIFSGPFPCSLSFSTLFLVLIVCKIPSVPRLYHDGFEFLPPPPPLPHNFFFIHSHPANPKVALRSTQYQNGKLFPWPFFVLYDPPSTPPPTIFIKKRWVEPRTSFSSLGSKQLLLKTHHRGGYSFQECS